MDTHTVPVICKITVNTGSYQHAKDVEKMNNER